MNVTESRFKNRQLHIEDYLRNRKSMQKCSTTLRLLKRAVSSQTIGRTILFFRSIIFVVCNPPPPLPLNHLTLAKGLLISHTWQYLYTKLDEFMELHNDDVEDQDEQIMGILEYLTEWLINHILYVDTQIPQG